MKMPRITSAITMPTSSTRCWCSAGHLERRHDDDEDEQVVDRQRVLGDVPGEELAGRTAPGEEPEPEPERHGQRDVEQHPAGGLAGGHRVRLVVDEEQVGQDDRDQATDGGQPEPQGHVHAGVLPEEVVRAASSGPRSLPSTRTKGTTTPRPTGDTGYPPERADTVLTMPPRAGYSPPVLLHCHGSATTAPALVVTDAPGRCASCAWCSRSTSPSSAEAFTRVGRRRSCSQPGFRSRIRGSSRRPRAPMGRPGGDTVGSESRFTGGGIGRSSTGPEWSTCRVPSRP